MKPKIIIYTFVFLIFFYANLYGRVLNIATTVAPYKFFIEQIVGNRAKVYLVIKPGINAHTFSPKPLDLLKLSKTDIYFACGSEFEKKIINKITKFNKNLKLVRVDSNIKKINIDGSNDKISDPHIWNSPPLVLIQCKKIYETLSKYDSNNKKFYKENFNRLKEKLNKLNLYIKKIFLNKDSKKHFITYHPSWGYFARSYGLVQLPIEKGEKKPGPRDLKNIIDISKKYNLKTIIVEPQFGASSPLMIAKAIGGGKLVEINPLSYNWIKTMKKLAISISGIKVKNDSK